MSSVLSELVREENSTMSSVLSESLGKNAVPLQYVKWLVKKRVVPKHSDKCDVEIGMEENCPTASYEVYCQSW